MSSAKKPLLVFVQYPSSAGETFKMDYYLETHMPLVQSRWGPHGLKSWIVTKLPPESGLCVQATLFWESGEAYEKGKVAEGKNVLGDIPNFSEVMPTITASEVVEYQSGATHWS